MEGVFDFDSEYFLLFWRNEVVYLSCECYNFFAVQAEMPMIANENKLWKIKFLPNFCQILDF